MSESNVYLDAFRISNYKSFTDTQEFSDLSKINIIIGKNNSGKSNVLSWLSSYYKNLVESCVNKQNSFDLPELPLKKGDNNFDFEIGISLIGNNFSVWRQNLDEKSKNYINESTFAKFIESSSLTSKKKIFWVKYEQENIKFNKILKVSPSLIEQVNRESLLNVQQWDKLYHNLINNAPGSDIKETISGIINAFCKAMPKIPNIKFIPAIREIKDEIKKEKHEEMFTDNGFDGSGLINQLANLQNPDPRAQYLKTKFTKINEFLQSVTNNKSAKIEIPASKKTITVHMDGKSLPIESLGTGIHEVVILAAAASLYQKQIICLEEPEIHLHPTLQKKLIKYLYENTSNQYFIATHSVHLLNSDITSIYHVQLEDGYSKVQHVGSPSEHSEVCIDLGYKASDIIQSNCIIWVEGPSDRIYLNHWIKSVDEELCEGIHYSIMFYGGRLLSHLTTNDPEVDEFISLRRLNRNVAILIDSDRKKSGDRINATKSRIRKEIEKESGFVWITSGKEIENYIPHKLMEKTIKEVHQSADKVMSENKYLSHLRYKTKTKEKDPKIADKVKVARKITENAADLSIDDLKKKINELVTYIKNANNIE